MSNKLIKSLILSVFTAGLLVAGSIDKAYAQDCEEIYGGGERCVFNKSFRITKEVREEDEDDDDADDKITVDEGEEFVFVIKIENTGDIEVDDMKMKDFLPDELEKVSGDLTEEWDDFEPGDEKKFRITARVKDDEFDRDNFEKCVVNKAEVRKDGDFKGSDTATVCYGKGKISELPDTGAESGLALGGLGLALIGAARVIRKKYL